MLYYEAGKRGMEVVVCLVFALKNPVKTIQPKVVICV